MYHKNGPLKTADSVLKSPKSFPLSVALKVKERSLQFQQISEESKWRPQTEIVSWVSVGSASLYSRRELSSLLGITENLGQPQTTPKVMKYTHTSSVHLHADKYLISNNSRQPLEVQAHHQNRVERWFKKLLIYWDFHAQTSLEFTENDPKKRRHQLLWAKMLCWCWRPRENSQTGGYSPPVWWR